MDTRVQLAGLCSQLPDSTRLFRTWNVHPKVVAHSFPATTAGSTTFASSALRKCGLTAVVQDPATRITTMSPITSLSIRVRRKQSMASPGSFTMGSDSLNEVLSTIGTPVSRSKASMSAR